MKSCDLCHHDSDRLTVIADHWGMGPTALCSDAEECSAHWAPAFVVVPAGESPETCGPYASLAASATAVVCYGQTFNSLDTVLPREATRRLARA